jgi:hypothetical protein
MGITPSLAVSLSGSHSPVRKIGRPERNVKACGVTVRCAQHDAGPLTRGGRYTMAPWQCLCFFPEPAGQGWLRPALPLALAPLSAGSATPRHIEAGLPIDFPELAQIRGEYSPHDRFSVHRLLR